MIGEVLDGKYRVLRLLGHGGMGYVYEAEPLEGGAHVAVKCIRGGLLIEGGTALDRFQREAKATSTIDTEHIVRVLDTGTDPASRTPYMAMELLEGEDLQHRLDRRGALRADGALRIAAQACLGLQKAHEARIIHRDIKPANIFLARRADGDIVVKILDFGIAKIKPDPSQLGATAGLTFTGGMLGTPRYMSPEQARGIKDIDFRADIWSLGVVLYCALSGRLPYEEIEAFGDLIMAICTRLPRPIQEVAPWVRPEEAAIVRGALQLQPGDRFQDMAAMLDAIRPLLPGGWDLREELLIPAGVSTNPSHAPTLTVEPPSRDRGPGSGAVARRGHEDDGSAERAVSGAERRVDDTGTTGEVGVATKDGETPAKTRDGAGARARARRSAAAAAAFTAVAGLGAFAFYEGWMRPAGGGAGGVETTLHATAGTTSALAPGAAVRRVSMAVSPAGVSVEIDGRLARVEGGKVEVEGTPGSVHPVRLFQGTKEQRGEVIITDVGASPAAMTLDVGEPAAAASATAAAGTKTASPGKTASPVKTAAAVASTPSTAIAPIATAAPAPSKPATAPDPLVPSEFH